jgi:predicted ATPase/transcriptional regulator with XRE-family HTH domain
VDPAPFGALLRRHRRAAGLSQEALAERAGVSARGISDLERGRRRWPHPTTVRRLSRALALDPALGAGLAAAAARPRRPDRGRPARLPASAGAGVAAAPGLPAPPTSFVGRERERAAVGRLLAAHRLVTLTGPAGVGKTRLALEVGRRLAAGGAGRYPDGVWLADLAPLADAALVAPTVAAALGVRAAPRRPVPAALHRALAPRRLLLILDNCEHLVAAAAGLVAGLLAAAPGVRVLATSREPLRVPGEASWPVDPLPPPPAGAAPAAVAASAAVRLFVARAAAVRPGFGLRPENAVAVADLCRRLDGLPLALELAAAAVRVLPVAELRDRLRDRFRLLTGGSRTALPRQQTLAAAVGWSYDRLDARERTLFARLSVFAGGWSLAAAEAVAADPDDPAPAPAAVLELLTRLVDRALVVAEEDGEGRARFRLLETLREYARERREASGAAAAVRRRHLAHYTALAEAAVAGVGGTAPREWLARLDREQDNCRAALNWVLAEPEPAALAQGLRLACALPLFWRSRGRWREARTWLDALLALPASGVPPAVRAAALGWAGGIADFLGDAPASRARREELVAFVRPTGDSPAAGGWLRGLGVGWAAGALPPDEAAAWLTQRLAFFREAADATEVAITLRELGRLALDQGDHRAAQRALEESLAVFRRLGDRLRTAAVLTNLGQTRRAAGDAAGSRAHFEEAVSICRQHGYENGVAGALLGLGEAALAAGDLARARPLFAESAARFREVGTPHDEAAALRSLALLANTAGDDAAAGRYLVKALAIWREGGWEHRVAETLEVLAGRAAAGAPERALRLAGAAAAVRETTGRPLPALRRTALERQLAPARRALGPEAVAAAVAAGRADSPEQAVAAALAP